MSVSGVRNSSYGNAKSSEDVQDRAPSLVKQDRKLKLDDRLIGLPNEGVTSLRSKEARRLELDSKKIKREVGNIQQKVAQISDVDKNLAKELGLEIETEVELLDIKGNAFSTQSKELYEKNVDMMKVQNNAVPEKEGEVTKLVARPRGKRPSWRSVHYRSQLNTVSATRKLDDVLQKYIELKYGDILDSSSPEEVSEESKNKMLEVNRQTGKGIFINELKDALDTAERIYTLERKVYEDGLVLEEYYRQKYEKKKNKRVNNTDDTTRKRRIEELQKALSKEMSSKPKTVTIDAEELDS